MRTSLFGEIFDTIVCVLVWRQVGESCLSAVIMPGMAGTCLAGIAGTFLIAGVVTVELLLAKRVHSLTKRTMKALDVEDLRAYGENVCGLTFAESARKDEILHCIMFPYI